VRHPQKYHAQTETTARLERLIGKEPINAVYIGELVLASKMQEEMRRNKEREIMSRHRYKSLETLVVG
jgi:hypothetical protein